MAANPDVLGVLEAAGVRFRYGVRHDRWGLALAAPSPFILTTGVLLASGGAVAVPGVALGIPFLVAGLGTGASGLSLWSRFRNGGPAIEWARNLRDDEIDAAFAADDLFAAAQLTLAGRHLERGKAQARYDAAFDDRFRDALREPAAAAALDQALATPSPDRQDVQRLVDRVQRRRDPDLQPMQAVEDPGPVEKLSFLARREVDHLIADRGVERFVDDTMSALSQATEPKRQHLLIAGLTRSLEHGGAQRIVDCLDAFDYDGSSLTGSARTSLAGLWHGAKSRLILDAIAESRRNEPPGPEPSGPTLG